MFVTGICDRKTKIIPLVLFVIYFFFSSSIWIDIIWLIQFGIGWIASNYLHMESCLCYNCKRTKKKKNKTSSSYSIEKEINQMKKLDLLLEWFRCSCTTQIHTQTFVLYRFLVLVWDLTWNGLAHLYVCQKFLEIYQLFTHIHKHWPKLIGMNDWPNEKYSSKTTKKKKWIKSKLKTLCVSLYTLKEAFLVFFFGVYSMVASKSWSI